MSSMKPLVLVGAALASVSEATFIYHRTDTLRTWSEANAFCQSKYGTTLASVANSAEKDQMASAMTIGGGEWAWFGLNDVAAEGAFSNVDGSAVSYYNWQPNEPNNVGNEDCVHFTPGTGGQWNDAGCGTRTKAFFCNGPAWLPASTIASDAWLLIHNAGAKNWDSAKQYCAANQGSTLASVPSSSANARMYAAMEKYGQSHAYIGLTDFVTEGVWQWADQSAVSYTNWAPNEPNNVGGNQDCALIWSASPAGSWDDENCQSAFGAFFCKL